MARRGTRRGGRKTGLFTRVYAPFKHQVSATRNVGKSVFKRTGRVVDQGLGAVDNIGTAITKHANQAVRNVTKRKGRKNTRKNTRRNRK
jgi:hypothetical protein